MSARKAMPVHHTDTVSEAWDAGAMLKRMGDSPGAAALRRMHAWVDPGGDPEAKSSYKLPHHMVDESGNVGPANMRACAAAMAVLNGARGGADIPEEDRQAVWDHLAAHMRDAGMEPPELKRSPSAVEHRAFTLQGLEIRAAGDGGPRIVGYAAVFDKPSVDLGGFTEIIRRGAFSKTLNDGADVRALWNHDPNYVLGRTKSGTLELNEDDTGLRIEISPPDTQWARDLMETIRRGDVDQMSFGFRTIRDRWQSDQNGVTVRELLEVALYDISPVTFPAYPDTQVQVRSAIAELQAQIDRLSQFLPAAPPLAGHPADDARRAIEAERRRRELELAELEI